MGKLKNAFDNIRPEFEEKGKLHFLRSVYEGFESFLFVP